MRIRIVRSLTLSVLVLNVLAVIFIWRLVTSFRNDSNLAKATRKPGITERPHARHYTDVEFIENSVTIVLRSFEFFENDVAGTIISFLTLYPNLRVLVVCDALPYPPLKLESVLNYTDNVKIVSMQLDLTNSLKERNPLFVVNTKYILLVPDSTRLISKNLLRTMISKLTRHPPHLVAVPLSKAVLCIRIHLELREWSIRYETINGDNCDAVLGKHVILAETEQLKSIPEPFMLPFPNALYTQSRAQDLKVKLIQDISFTEGKSLFESHHAQWKVAELSKARDEDMFRHFRLKKVIRETGLVEMHGCTRETNRCFGTVVHDTPQYLYEGKHTPPCCLSWLRQTASHVFKTLDSCGVRYWLEGGSLLGAMRSSDIIPWDYDVDVGIYLEDVASCSPLAEARTHKVIDKEGYLWEKATEGDFYRVQFSVTNHLHVDLFPFFSRNGTMTKNTWFAGHRQDCEFPEHFLQPISNIEFVGRQVPAPNNIRDFLELKFGKGVIETPQYPDPKRLKFDTKDIPENTNLPLDDF